MIVIRSKEKEDILSEKQCENEGESVFVFDAEIFSKKGFTMEKGFCSALQNYKLTKLTTIPIFGTKEEMEKASSTK